MVPGYRPHTQSRARFGVSPDFELLSYVYALEIFDEFLSRFGSSTRIERSMSKVHSRHSSGAWLTVVGGTFSRNRGT